MSQPGNLLEVCVSMSKQERILVTVFVALACPFTTLVLFWWGGAGLAMYGVLPFGERGIVACALVGLTLGLILDAVLLPRWVSGFYRLRLLWLLPLYALWSTIAAAFFMGMPFGNLALGTAVGVYLGRRAAHFGVPSRALPGIERRAASFTTYVLTAWSLPFALLALSEGAVVRTIHAVLGWTEASIKGVPGIALMCVICLVLAAVQFQLTARALRRSYSLS